MSMHETVHVICCLQDKPVKCIMTVVVRARSTIVIHLCINYSASRNPERRMFGDTARGVLMQMTEYDHIVTIS